MSKEIAKKALSIASKVLMWIIIAVTVCMMIFTLVSTLAFDRNDRNLFGIRFYVVLSDSMSLSENNKDDEVHFNAGDIVLIKNVKNANDLQPGEVIAFVSQNSSSYGETVTHMIRERRTNTEGKLLGYVTYGTNTGTNDEVIVEPEYVLGTYAGRLPMLGRFFQFLKTTPGYIVCILVPFLLLILGQGINTVKLFKQYKKEQMADVQAEREQLAKEREESAAILRELQALKEQLAQRSAGGETPAEMTRTEEPNEDPSISTDPISAETTVSFTDNSDTITNKPN